MGALVAFPVLFTAVLVIYGFLRALGYEDE